jgi:hypothetical protein
MQSEEGAHSISGPVDYVRVSFDLDKQRPCFVAFEHESAIHGEELSKPMESFW